MKEIHYADNLMLLGKSWEEVEERYSRWKKAIEETGIKVNIKQKPFLLVRE